MQCSFAQLRNMRPILSVIIHIPETVYRLHPLGAFTRALVWLVVDNDTEK